MARVRARRRVYENEKTRARARRVREALNAIKLASGCIDCGYNAHPAALQFDHRDPSLKAFNLSQAKSKSWPSVLAEVEKCDVRCANCHAVKTVEAGEQFVGKARHFDVCDPKTQLLLPDGSPRLLQSWGEA